MGAECRSYTRLELEVWLVQDFLYLWKSEEKVETVLVDIPVSVCSDGHGCRCGCWSEPGFLGVWEPRQAGILNLSFFSHNTLQHTR